MAYTTIDDPESYFQSKLYSGTGSDQSITLDGENNLQPDLIWVKRRNGTGGHGLVDSVRGANKWLASEGTGGEDTATENITFGSDGFTWNGGNYDRNSSGETYVAWCWKMGTASGITTNGSTTITPSSYSFSSTAGVSISQYTGNGTAGAKLAHGIGGEPDMFWVKQVNGGNPWVVYFKSLGNTKVMYLNTNGASATRSNAWNDTSPDSVNITLGQGGGDINYDSSRNYLCFAMRNIVGFSHAGSYTGNGNADGPMIFTGMKPALVTVKRYNSTGSWNVFDNKREGFNPDNSNLYWNTTSVEQTDSDRTNPIDFLSNGFKLRGTDTDVNGSGSTYVYLAFAESPFVNSNGVPNNAE